MLKIVKQHANGVFKPDEVSLLVAAFDDCWRRFQKSGARFGSERAMQRAREQLGKSMIEAAMLGERDPRRLCEDAMLHMAQSSIRDVPEK